MNDSQTTAPAYDDEIDLREIIRALWNGRRVIALCVAAGIVGGVAYALLATPQYRSEALLEVREAEAGGRGLGSLSSRFGGLADLVGVSLGGDGGDRDVSIATLKSRSVVQRFIVQEKLLPKLYPGRWDADAQKWRSNDPKDIPSLWEAYSLFVNGPLRISDDKKTGLVTVAIEWRDPQEAARWVTALVAVANAHLQQAALAESQRNLAYLEEQAKNATVLAVQQSVYSLIEAEMRKLMLAKGGDEYAFKTIDPAQVPTLRFKPKRKMIVLLGAMFGGVLGVAVLFFRAGLVSEALRKRG